jgi:hypothetical protein
MMQARLQAKWVATFEREFALCALTTGDSVVILSEAQSRPVPV